MHEPNFMIIGAAKAATTTLTSLLNAHPQAAIVDGKEPHYFSFLYPHLPYSQYLQGYRYCTSEIAVGDASTSYSRIRHHPGVAERIHAHVPNAKIIYMVRHPLERMESAYFEHAGSIDNGVFASINEVVRQKPMLVDSSRYWEVFDSYRRVFGEDQIKVVWFDRFTAEMAQEFAEVCRFLGIDPGLGPAMAKPQMNSREHAAARARAKVRDISQVDAEWDDATRREVIATLRDDNLRFLEHFDKPSDYWGDLFGV